MSEMEEIKNEDRDEDKSRPRNFRFKNGTVNTFTNIASEFDNQDQAMNALLEAYKREKMKEEIPERSGDISKFQEYLGILLSRYISCVKESQTSDERARAEVQELLASKDSMIISLQDANKELQQKLEFNQKWRQDAENDAKQAKSEVEEQQQIVKGLNADYAELEKRSQESVKDKERIIDVLGKKVEELESKIQDYSSLAAKIEELEEAGRKLEKSLQEAEQAKKDMEHSHSLEMLKAESGHECEILEIRAEKETALRTEFEKSQKALKELRAEKDRELQQQQEKIEKLQLRIESLIEANNVDYQAKIQELSKK